jgi:hypothetical protein
MKCEKTISCGATIILSLILSWSTYVHAQESSKAEIELKGLSEERLKFRDELKKGKSERSATGEMRSSIGYTPGNQKPAIPPPPDPESLDAPTKEKYLAALREYYEYHISGLHHRKKVFEWQLFSSKLIFVVVLLLVFSGICFAAIQFHGTFRRKDEIGAPDSHAVSEFVASVKGDKVGSPVLGVVILVISMVFFYLYLLFVYPIENVF